MVYLNQEQKSTIICLTPVKNEAWILHRFLKCTSLWADHIIIADQQSTDGSQEIANQYPKVKLIENSSPVFNEPERQKLLIEEARKIPGKKLLIALDADEMLTANFMNSSEWNTILYAPIGTVIQFDRVNLLSDMCSHWIGEYNFPCAFVDDGSEHIGNKIHSPRIPSPTIAHRLILRDIKLLHYQFTDWERMRSKHRWYQCWERINQPSKRALNLYRQYHHMYTIDQKIQSNPSEWLDGYDNEGIDMTSIYSNQPYWWDREVLDLFSKYGLKTFKQLNIWDVDWAVLSKKISPENKCYEYEDPRSSLEKYIHIWLEKTQDKSDKLLVRLMQKILSITGW